MKWLHLAMPALAFCWLISSGCSGDHEKPIAEPEDVARYASLPKLRETHDQQLRDELARITGERATPAHLHAEPPARRSEWRVALSRLFPDDVVEEESKRFDELFAADRLAFDGLDLRVVSNLLGKHDQRRGEFRQMISDPTFCFPIQHDRGLAGDTSYVGAARMASRLETLLGLDLLAREPLMEAIEPLEFVFRTARTMAREAHVVSRIAGVHMRAEGLLLLETIADDPRFEERVCRRLLGMVRQQLQDWPADKLAWIGDRAQGLHTYELVRDGYLLSILSYDEVRKYREAFGLDHLAKRIAQNIDYDEQFYLKTMRRAIESCGKPFYQRKSFFRRLEADREQLRDSAVHPFVADQILLTNLVEGQRLQSLDRARCEAWDLALSLALGEACDRNVVNPLTGHKYVIECDDQQALVDGIDPERLESHIELKRIRGD